MLVGILNLNYGNIYNVQKMSECRLNYCIMGNKYVR